MVMRSISWLRPSTLLRKRGADDLDIGMGIRMVLGIGDCKTGDTERAAVTKTSFQKEPGGLKSLTRQQLNTCAVQNTVYSLR